jgi:hypothetical protein
MADDAPTSRSARFDDLDRLLAERGHDLASGRIRIAAGRSGVAVGFPKAPLIHLAWWALVPLALVAAARLARQAGL